MELLEIYLQSQTHRVISQDIKSGMLNHCYMISSKDEKYLHELAINVAKEIMCMGENAPCDTCVNCMRINHSNMVDLIVYPKSDKNLMVDDINEIVSDCYIRPMSSKYKIYILQRFDECTVQAQNKILKTLEEPPANVIFILTCVNDLQVLQTIASRSKKIFELPISSELLKKYLLDNGVKESELIANISQGSLTIADRLGNSATAIDVINLIFDILTNLKTSADILKFSSRVLAIKKDMKFFLETFVSVLRDLVICENNENIIFKDRKSDYSMLSKFYNKPMILKIIERITIINDKMDFNCNMTGIVDQMLLDILEVKFLWQK